MRRKKVLFVGDRPSKLNKDPNIAFKGARCENRLLGWIKYADIDDYRIINSVNENAIQIVLEYLGDENLVVPLGRVAMKFLQEEFLRLPAKPAFARHFATIIDNWVFEMPHPSGRNRQLNDKIWLHFKLEEFRMWIEKNNSESD